MTTPSHQYLQGNFGPVQEEVTAVDLPVTGTIPAELDGRLLRNGPNPIGTTDPATYHWFTGDGMVHGVRLRDGSAEWYRNRWVRSPEVAEALGEAAPPSPYGDDVQTFAANTNVVNIAGKTFAIVEAGAPPVELTDELETVGPSNFSGTLEHPFSAHPKVDPVTGEMHVVAYYWAWGNKIRYMSVSPDGRVQKSVDVETPGSPMVHDMAFTEKYALLFDLPVTFNLDDAMAGRRLPYRWNDEYGARIGLLPRTGAAADVRWFEIEPCFFYHPLNAYDLDDGRVVLDAVRHPKMFATDMHGPARRATPLGSVDDRSVRRQGAGGDPRRPRAGVPAAQRDPAGATEPLRLRRGHRLRYDAITGRRSSTTWWPGPRPSMTTDRVGSPWNRCSCRVTDATAEDDGWVISYVYDSTTDTTDVVILDGQDFTGDPVATIHLPVRVPFGFHGNWIPTP